MNESINNTPDLHSSSVEYSKRFSGMIGNWMLGIQGRAIMDLINGHLAKGIKRQPLCKVIDVGGGHGQIAPLLVDAGFTVDVYGSSEAAFENLRENYIDGAPTRTETLDEKNGQPVIRMFSGSFEKIEVPDRSYHAAVSLRILPHIIDPKNLISELCRVSSHAVIIDYPTIHSVNFFSYLLFPLKKYIEKNTRRFHLFTTAAINREFNKNGFQVIKDTGQFFFPMALHRLLKNPALSDRLESAARVSGLAKYFSSPKIALAIRKNNQ